MLQKNPVQIQIQRLQIVILIRNLTRENFRKSQNYSHVRILRYQNPKQMNTRNTFLMIAAIIVHESTVNRKAVSKGGDYGLMQVRWKVHAGDIKKRFPEIKSASGMFNARTNIMYGTEINAQCMSKTGTLEKALMRYSSGSTKLTTKVLQTLRDLKAN